MSSSRIDGMGGRNMDARTQFFYFATVNTPAMTWKLIGKGSQYAWGYLDANGDYLDGSKTYKLNLPKDPPAKKFISIVLYDPQTRSQLQTSQPFPSYNSEKHKGKVAVNDDGSDRSLLRPRGTCRQGSELAPNGSRQGLVLRVASLQPDGALVRQNLAAW